MCSDSEGEEEFAFVGYEKESLERTYEATFREHIKAEREGNKRMLPENVNDELWVIKPVDYFPKSLEESKLKQKGGVVIKGNLQLMTFPYYLKDNCRGSKGQTT